jgi:hypothetical protein
MAFATAPPAGNGLAVVHTLPVLTGALGFPNHHLVAVAETGGGFIAYLEHAGIASANPILAPFFAGHAPIGIAALWNTASRRAIPYRAINNYGRFVCTNRVRGIATGHALARYLFAKSALAKPDLTVFIPTGIKAIAAFTPSGRVVNVEAVVPAFLAGLVGRFPTGNPAAANERKAPVQSRLFGILAPNGKQIGTN